MNRIYLVMGALFAASSLVGAGLALWIEPMIQRTVHTNVALPIYQYPYNSWIAGSIVVYFRVIENTTAWSGTLCRGNDTNPCAVLPAGIPVGIPLSYTNSNSTNQSLCAGDAPYDSDGGYDATVANSSGAASLGGSFAEYLVAGEIGTLPPPDACAHFTGNSSSFGLVWVMGFSPNSASLPSLPYGYYPYLGILLWVGQ